MIQVVKVMIYQTQGIKGSENETKRHAVALEITTARISKRNGRLR